MKKNEKIYLKKIVKLKKKMKKQTKTTRTQQQQTHFLNTNFFFFIQNKN
jgi:hypothetical protein